MHAERELSRLATHKAALQRRIGLNRHRCAAAVTRVSQPLAWLDRMAGLWRQFSPFIKYAVVPLGILLKRSTATRPRQLGGLLRWAPLVFGALRGLAGTKPR